MNELRKKLFLNFMALSPALYILCMPTYPFCINYYSDFCREHTALWILLFGRAALSHGWPYIIWTANILLFLSWPIVLMSNHSEKYSVYFIGEKYLRFFSIFLSFSTLLLALSFLLPLKIVTNAGGAANPIKSYELGYWLWIASMACVAAASLLAKNLHRK